MNFFQHLQGFLRSIFQWWVIITPWQQGVRVRIGKHIKPLPPGIHVKWPIIDAVYMQPIRIRSQHIGSQTLTTSDDKTISLASAILYEITDLLLLYQKLHNAHDVIEQLAQGAVSSFVSDTKLESLGVRKIEDHVTEELDLGRFGLKIKEYKLTSFAVVRTYRLISGEVGTFTGYDQRLETSLAVGDADRRRG